MKKNIEHGIYSIYAIKCPVSQVRMHINYG